MDDNQPEAQFSVGDLVSCWYTFYQYYASHYNELDQEELMVGVIVEIDYAQYEGWPMDTIYIVFCTDGAYRFFVEEELFRLS